jgi:uncharacterized membrane protein YesL
MDTGSPFLNVMRLAVRDWWHHGLHLTLLNLIWLVAWVSVVLGPPVTLAVYAFMHQLVHDATTPELTPGEFLRSVRTHFWKGWLWMLPNLAVIPGLLINLGFYGQFDAPWAVALEVVTVVLVVFWFFLQFYALPYLLVQERRSLRLAYRNAALTTLASPLYSLLFAIVIGLLLLLSARFVVLLFLMTPVLIAMMGTHAVRERLQHFKVHDRSAP